MNIKELTDELERAKKENEELNRQIRWFKAAHWLLAHDEAFIYEEGGSCFFLQAKIDEDKGCSLALNMNDTFDYACADAEPFTYEQAEELVSIAKDQGWPGLVKWAAAKRGYEPLEPIKEAMLKYEEEHRKDASET